MAAGVSSKEEKRPFDIPEMMVRIAEGVKPYPPAALFQLRDEGFGSPFEILVACILSIRTLDEVMLVAAHRLFEQARTPAAIAALPAAKIDALIRDCGFHENKAVQIQAIALQVHATWHDELPCSDAELQSLAGVGPKCAHLTLGIACDQKLISVDTHVHRVTNRWGYVAANTPEATMTALEAVLPRDYWVEINRLLVPFGKHICTARRPACPTCPVREFCRQMGVEEVTAR